MSPASIEAGQELRVIAAYVSEQNPNLIVGPPAGVQTVTFSLPSYSSWLGYAMNQGSDAGPDFQWVNGAPTVTVAFDPVSHVAVVTLLCKDYGGRAVVRAEVQGIQHETTMGLPKDESNGVSNWLPDTGWTAAGNGTINGYPGTLNDAQEPVLDSFGDGDQWSDTDEGTTWDATRPNSVPGKLGDGLTVFEEYRGFIVRGEHRRLNPARKDLFVSSAVVGEGLIAGEELFFASGALRQRGVRLHTLYDETEMVAAPEYTIVYTPPSVSSPGTEVPPAPQVIDTQGGIWTLGTDGKVLRNGSHVGGYASSLLWTDGILFAHSVDNQWYKWAGTGWWLHGASKPTVNPPAASVSHDGTEVPSASQIVDSHGGTWTLGTNGEVLRNGVHADGGSALSLLWTGGILFALAGDNQWYRWAGTGWWLHGPSKPAGCLLPPSPLDLRTWTGQCRRFINMNLTGNHMGLPAIDFNSVFKLQAQLRIQSGGPLGVNVTQGPDQVWYFGLTRHQAQQCVPVNTFYMFVDVGLHRDRQPSLAELRNNEIRRTVAHEIGHAIHVNHRGDVNTCDSENPDSGISLMGGYFNGSSASGAWEYNQRDVEQMRFHLNQ